MDVEEDIEIDIDISNGDNMDDDGSDDFGIPRFGNQSGSGTESFGSIDGFD